MNPGRELDALVAEKVFGWKRIPAVYGRKELWSPPGSPPEANIWNIEPKLYSTDIAAAWEVVKYMRSRKIPCRITVRAFGIEPGFKVGFIIIGDRDYIADAETMPHAICLAALKVCWVEI